MRINNHQREFKKKLESVQTGIERKPDWFKVKIPAGKNYADVKKLMREKGLNTVCEEARCPNISECWNNRTATFMILGDTCTRSCGFCSVKVGMPNHLDHDEPARVADSVKSLNLKHVVITSVNRDELKDGGASIFSETIRLINIQMPDTTIEILIPDFKGEEHAFEIIMQYPPTILNHNLETVPELYHVVRPQAKYERSLNVINWFHKKGLITKSGLMVGIGEKADQVLIVMKDLRKNGCQILTIGQYLKPTNIHLPVDRYVSPEEFKMYKEEGLKMGFKVVESAPLVRSSYHADMAVEKLRSINLTM
jgi:lipoyl synthase